MADLKAGSTAEMHYIIRSVALNSGLSDTPRPTIPQPTLKGAAMHADLIKHPHSPSQDPKGGATHASTLLPPSSSPPVLSTPEVHADLE